MKLVANQQEALRDGVRHQVEAGSHDDGDDAQVDGRAGQRPGAAFEQLTARQQRSEFVEEHLCMSS